MSFRVGDGAKTALLGANGTGKTTLLRLIAGDLEPAEGTIVRSGGLGVMRQFIGSVRDATTVRAFLAAMAPPRGSASAAESLAAAERARRRADESGRADRLRAGDRRLDRRRRLGGRGAVGDLHAARRSA